MFFIHDPVPELSTAQNILHMLRPDMKFTDTEARVLDMALVLHAEHGGGNNSSFTTHVVTSSGTDTYSAIAAALGQPERPQHGGANIKVCHMFDEIKEQVGDWADDDEVGPTWRKSSTERPSTTRASSTAWATRSTPVRPRAVIFKSFVHQLAQEKGMEAEYPALFHVERIAPEIISGERKMYKGVSANVDFYSGFVYQMLGFPESCSPPVRHRPDQRLERPPAGGAGQRQPDHPARLQGHPAPAGGMWTWPIGDRSRSRIPTVRVPLPHRNTHRFLSPKGPRQQPGPSLSAKPFSSPEGPVDLGHILGGGQPGVVHGAGVLQGSLHHGGMAASYSCWVQVPVSAWRCACPFPSS